MISQSLYQVTLTKRDVDQKIKTDDVVCSPGTSLNLIVQDYVDEEILRNQLKILIAPDVDIWVTRVRLMTEHHYVAIGESIRIDGEKQ